MEYTTLGNTGLLVSKLCFGTMTFGDGRGLFKLVGAQGQTEADELVKTSLERALISSTRLISTPKARAKRSWGNR